MDSSDILLEFFLSNERGFILEIFLKNFSDGRNLKLLRKDSELFACRDRYNILQEVTL
jgi:hypothetical protein